MIRDAAWQCFEKSKRPATTDEVQKEIDALVGEQNGESVERELVAKVIKQATRITSRDGGAVWLSIIVACNEQEAKLLGHFEAGKREGQKPPSRGNYRAAGRTPAQTHEKMAARLAEVLSQRREALVGGAN
jgi:hypothetical protein